MKVLYLTHSESIQGAGIALLNIVRGMVSHGIECVVIVPFHGEMEKNLVNIGVKCYISRCYNAIYPQLKGWMDYVLWPYRLGRTILTNAIAKRRLLRIVDIEHPDIIHTNTGVVRFGASVALKKSIPHVWHIREFQTRDFFGVPLGGEKKVQQLYHSQSNHCVAITKSVFEHFSLSEPKDHVVYDGVFSKDVLIPQKYENKRYLLFVGSLQRGKGIYDALLAFDSVAKQIPRHELWIAGNDYIDINKEILNLKNASQVKYLGFRSDVYELMANATAVLVPSYYEGFGFITAEAMLNKTIVIGRDVAGTKEQFDNGLNSTGKEIGIRFHNMEELSRAILNVCIKPYTAFQEMTDNAYKVVMENYTIEKNTEKILAIYEQLLNK